MNIKESAENYLETIYMLGLTSSSVRSIDVAKKLGFSKPSVCIAVRKLRENKYLKTEADGALTLTSDGIEIAEKMFERHKLFSDWLIFLGVDPSVATEDACRIEHFISEETFLKIKKHILSNKEHI